MKIEYLSDNIAFADQVSRWIYDEFFENIRTGITYDEVLSDIKNCHKTEFPIRLVAIVDEKCVGTVSIVQNDLKCRGYTPWLAALYVDEAFRNQKIGEQLISGVKTIVKDLGYSELYLRTEHTSNYYRRLGWQFIESCEDSFNLRPDVFKFVFDAK